jgi:MoaA/NifB/PqqE/SkfB family radical SAM enzyme
MEAKMVDPVTNQETASPASSRPSADTPLAWKLWVYTNYDCNLSCSYCVAESSPRAARRGLSLETIQQLVDEAIALGFGHILFTGGEPFVLDGIYDMLAYASAKAQTTVLTNAMLLHGSRLERLAAVASDRLTVQVSLDGARPEQHDTYRGAGTWLKTMEAIRRLQERGFHLRLSTTETPANIDHMDELHALRRSLGIPAEDHVIRPLAHRGFAHEGIEVTVNNLVPEVTVTVDGVFWHPLASPSSRDMQVSSTIFPLAAAVDCIEQQLDSLLLANDGQPLAVT